MPYPSTVSAYTNPNPTDRLSSPSHSSIETAQNTGLTEIQTFVGTTNTSLVGTLIHDIRSPDSDGGGHIQAANKGGTGQTNYSKGVLLVGQSSSVLTKLAVGNDGQVLVANSSVATGVKWTTNTSPKISASASVFTAGTSTANEVSILSVTIPGSTLGTNNAVEAELYLRNFVQTNANQKTTFRFNYGSTSIATFGFGSISGMLGNDVSVKGVIWARVIGNGAVSSQRGVIYTDIRRFDQSGGNLTSSIVSQNANMSLLISEDSDVNKTFGITIQNVESNSGNRVEVEGHIVKRII